MKCGIAAVFVGVLAAVSAVPVNTEGEWDGVSPHVIGGHEVPYFSSPHTVKLRAKLIENSKYRHCGAARLTSTWFITAAECLDGKIYMTLQLTYPDEMNMFLRHYLFFDEMKYSIHPNYNSNTKANNVAVFMCPDCLTVRDPNTLPQLPRKSAGSFVGLDAAVSGWTIDDPQVESQPRNNIESYDTTIVSSSECKVASGYICAASGEGEGLGEADVGVPMIIRGSGQELRSTLIGIASSVELQEDGFPGRVFTNIVPTVEWISEETGIPLRD